MPGDLALLVFQNLISSFLQEALVFLVILGVIKAVLSFVYTFLYNFIGFNKY